MPVASGWSFDPLAYAAFAMRFSAERYFFDTAAGVAIPADVGANTTAFGGLFAELGAGYYFGTGEFAVYASGGLFSFMVGPNTGLHLAVYGSLGGELLRFSTARLAIDLRVAQHVIPFKGQSAGLTWAPQRRVSHRAAARGSAVLLGAAPSLGAPSNITAPCLKMDLPR